MIQRIQSIYLLLAAILMAVTAFSPLLELASSTKFVVYFWSLGIGQLLPASDFPTWGVVTMAIISALFSLITIFMYKKRALQIKFLSASVVTIVLFYITVAVYLTSYFDWSFSFSNIKSIQFGFVLPIISAILLFLAQRAIKKDDKLVRSLDRIR